MRPLTLAVATTAFALITPASAASRIEVDKDAAKVVLSVEGKERHYFRLPAERPLEIRVLGPASLVATVRVLFSTSTSDSVVYRIPVSMDDEAPKRHKRDSHRSEKVRTVSGARGLVPGVSNKISVQVPEGPHVLRWGPLKFVGDKPANAVVSFLRERQKVSLTPSHYAWLARDRYKSSDRTWYAVTKTDAVLIDVVGPARLEIASSLNFSSGLRGTQNYTLKAEIDDKSSRLWTLKAVKSEEGAYLDRPDVVPGTPNKSILRIAKGKHTVRVMLAHTMAGSACLRLLVPKRQALANTAEPGD